MDNSPKIDRVNLLVGAVVILTTLVIYLKTVAVSVSLWDCGEFIGCSRIFGIAHPPGTPLFIMIGRIFSLIPFAQDIAHRINLVASLGLTATAGFSYFVLAKVIRWWIGPKENFWERLPIYLGGFTGALIMSFSRTWWANAIEAEVYGIACLTSVAVIYIALIWFERRENPSSDKLVFLMIFLAMLGVGAHLAAFMVMPAVFLFIFLSSPRLLKSFLVWVSVLCSLALLVGYQFFFYATAIWVIIALLGTLMSKNYFWRWALAFTLFSALGFSLQYSTIVRAKERPRINMTDASTWQRMTDYLERKQYGQGNMITRMFHRRGTLANQFGDYPRMGMLGFWKHQYSSSKIPFVLWLFVGLWGIYYAMKQHWKMGSMLLILIIVGTIGITLYMNFADGTQVAQDPNAKLEVRDRDYFWTQGFGFFAWGIGLGVAAALHALTNCLRKREGWRKFILPVSAAFGLTIFLPVFGITNSYHYNNRSSEWLPYQYAHDILSTCDRNAVLFTGGDNDTYPLWALQEAYGYRQDVKIINLSLANVDWYLLHVKNVFGAPMAVDNDQIEVRNFETPNGLETRPARPYYDNFDKAWMYFGSRPVRDPKTGRMSGLIEMAQLTMEKVIEAAMQKKGDTITMRFPIYFTSLIDPVRSVRYTDIMQNVEKVAALYRTKDTIILNQPKSAASFYPYTYDLDRTYDLYNNVFIFNGMRDPDFTRGEFTTMMVYRYYSVEYGTLIDSLLARKDPARCINILKKGIALVPEYNETPRWRVLLDSLTGQPTNRLYEYENEYVSYMRKLIQLYPDNYYYIQFMSRVMVNMGKSPQGDAGLIKEALSYLDEAYRTCPDPEWIFESILSGNVAIKDADRLQTLIRQYKSENPQDYFRPIFLMTAEYVDGAQIDNLETLLRAYFSTVGADAYVFREIIRYTLAKQSVEAMSAVQKVYFEVNPGDRESLNFLKQLYQSAVSSEDLK